MAGRGGEVDGVVGGFGAAEDGNAVDVGVLKDILVARPEGGRVQKGCVEGFAAFEGGHVGDAEDAGGHDQFFGF